MHIKCLLLGHAGGGGAPTGGGVALLGADGAAGGGGEDDDPERINAQLQAASKRGAMDLTGPDDTSEDEEYNLQSKRGAMDLTGPSEDEEYYLQGNKRRHIAPATFGGVRLDSNIP